jgi:hypothetical protein
MSINSWKPVVVLPETRRRNSQSERGPVSSQVPEDELDKHVKDLLRFVLVLLDVSPPLIFPPLFFTSNRDKIRRTLQGVKSFLKTRVFRLSICLFIPLLIGLH